MENKEYIVVDNKDCTMSLETADKLESIAPNTYEKRHCKEAKPIICYKIGTYEECQKFIAKQDQDVQKCLDITHIDPKYEHINES